MSTMWKRKEQTHHCGNTYWKNTTEWWQFQYSPTSKWSWFNSFPSHREGKQMKVWEYLILILTSGWIPKMNSCKAATFSCNQWGELECEELDAKRVQVSWRRVRVGAGGGELAPGDHWRAWRSLSLPTTSTSFIRWPLESLKIFVFANNVNVFHQGGGASALQHQKHKAGRLRGFLCYNAPLPCGGVAG